jgi:DNA-binding winged helix-turn-helix (wHTH) protein
VDEKHPMSGENRKVVSFGPFELSIFNRLLTNGTKVVPLGARAMDILMVLVEQPNKVVSRRTLIERVWPKRGADGVSLRVHISALRKALAQSDPTRRYIANVPGRGYSFIVPITSPSESSEIDVPARSWLPARLTRMVGRKDAIASIQAKLVAQKFVTIVGPGGLGKTTVAVAVAHEMRSAFDGRVRFVDLSHLGEASLVAPAVASSFGLAIQSNDVVPALVDRLLEAQTLLVLDGCEHLIDAASVLAERLFCSVPTLHLLATSREAMRVEGENVFELAALGVLRTMRGSRHRAPFSIQPFSCWSTTCGPCEVNLNRSTLMRRLRFESAGGLMEFHWQSNSPPAGLPYLASATPQACLITT